MALLFSHFSFQSVCLLRRLETHLLWFEVLTLKFIHFFFHIVNKYFLPRPSFVAGSYEQDKVSASVRLPFWCGKQPIHTCINEFQIFVSGSCGGEAWDRWPSRRACVRRGHWTWGEAVRPQAIANLVFSSLWMILEGKTDLPHHCSPNAQHRVAA